MKRLLAFLMLYLTRIKFKIFGAPYKQGPIEHQWRRVDSPPAKGTWN